ncbi:hypothetical protein [Streptomyces sp. enrichment culture]|uniref:hypothetical protein n=1 Tax=Streptomyces sp. enrichment culture TaxID=1795815 RepID=UPI003F558CA5
MRENDPDRALRATMESFLAALESSVDTDASLAQVYAAQSAGPVSPDQYSVESRNPISPNLQGRILVVNDNKTLRQLIRINLELEGFEVLTAASKLQAQETTRQVELDVVVLEIMPDYEAVGQIIVEIDPSIKVILTGVSTPTTEPPFPLHDQIARPFEVSDLVSAVSKAIAARRQPRAAPGEAKKETDSQWMSFSRPTGC